MAGEKKTGYVSSAARTRQTMASAAPAPAVGLGSEMAAAFLDMAEQAGVVTAATRGAWVARMESDHHEAMGALAGMATASVPAGVRARAQVLSASASVPGGAAGERYTHPASVLAGVIKAKAEARAAEVSRAPAAQIAVAAASLPKRPGPSASLVRALAGVPGHASGSVLGSQPKVRLR